MIAPFQVDVTDSVWLIGYPAFHLTESVLHFEKITVDHPHAFNNCKSAIPSYDDDELVEQ
jgi:hypothetical protein